MGDTSRDGIILHRYRIRQDWIDDTIDRKSEEEPYDAPELVILPDGTRRWIFNRGGRYAI